MRRSVLLMLFFIGCATSTMITGKDFDITKAEQITKGVTTQDQVRSLLGEPFQRSTHNSTEVWKYQYIKAVGRATSFVVVTNATGQAFSKTLTIMFDSMRVAQSVSSSVTGDPEAVK